MRAGVIIEGARELDANLATLGQRIHRKVIRQAVRDGQRPMLSAIKANARSMVGGQMGSQLASAYQIRAPRRQRSGSYSLHVQLKPDEQFIHTTKSGKREFIPAAIEYGHISGESYVPPIPFGRSAAETTRDETIRRFTDMLRIGLLREAIKARSA